MLHVVVTRIWQPLGCAIRSCVRSRPGRLIRDHSMRQFHFLSMRFLDAPVLTLVDAQSLIAFKGC